MKYELILFGIIFLLDYIKSEINCKTHLNCQFSACCVNGVCESSDVCKENMNTVYIIVALLGFGFLAISIVYFIVSLRSSARNMKNLKEKFLGNLKPATQ